MKTYSIMPVRFVDNTGIPQRYEMFERKIQSNNIVWAFENLLRRENTYTTSCPLRNFINDWTGCVSFFQGPLHNSGNYFGVHYRTFDDPTVWEVWFQVREVKEETP